MQQFINFFKNNLGLLGATIAGLLFRLWNLTGISLWHDEAFSALLIKYSWGEMIYRIGLDVHPPMYYIFLRIWHYVLGDSLFALRGMSVLFGVLTIVAAYYFVLYAFKSKRAAVFSAILVAVNPFQVQYVTEARMYTMTRVSGYKCHSISWLESNGCKSMKSFSVSSSFRGTFSNG